MDYFNNFLNYMGAKVVPTEISDVNLYRKTYYDGENIAKNCWGEEYYLEEHGKAYHHACSCSKGFCRTEPPKDEGSGIPRIKKVLLNGNFKWTHPSDPNKFIQVYLESNGSLRFEYNLSESEMVFNNLSVDDNYVNLEFWAPFYHYERYSYSFTKAEPRSEEEPKSDGSYNLGGGTFTRLIEDGRIVKLFKEGDYMYKCFKGDIFVWNYVNDDKITPESWFHYNKSSISNIQNYMENKYYGALIKETDQLEEIITNVLPIQKHIRDLVKSETSNFQNPQTLDDIEILLRKEFCQEKYTTMFNFILNTLNKTPCEYPKSWREINKLVYQYQYPNSAKDKESLDFDIDSDYVYNNYQQIIGSNTFRNGYQFCLSQRTTQQETPFMKKYREQQKTGIVIFTKKDIEEGLKEAEEKTYIVRCPSHSIPYNTGSTLEEVLKPYIGLSSNLSTNIQVLTKSFYGTYPSNKSEQMKDRQYESSIRDNKVLKQAKQILTNQ